MDPKAQAEFTPILTPAQAAELGPALVSAEEAILKAASPGRGAAWILMDALNRVLGVGPVPFPVQVTDPTPADPPTRTPAPT